MDVFWTLPPVSRTITALAVGVSAAGYGGLVSLSQFVFFKPYVFTTKTVPQLWRPLTAFFITKPKFAILLDPYFCYQYGSGLERESPRFTQPGDFFVYTAFCATVIVVSILLLLPSLPEAVPGIEEEYPCTSPSSIIHIIQRDLCGVVSAVGLPLHSLRGLSIPLGGCGSLHALIRWLQKALAGGFLNSYTFLPALTMSYAYTFAQDSPTRQVSFFILNFDAKYLPFALLFMSFIMDGPDSAMAQLTGLLAAHLYDFLTRIWPTFGGGKNYIITPDFVKRAFGAGVGSMQNRGFGHAVQGSGRATGAGAGAPAGAGSGRSTGTTRNWGGVGPGRRLGE
ncbi:Der1-like family-domain-containing protein [Phaeosphaeria sp. MPI-PUGE-AT-0046c]|nr:Der1-like family-domain-containing protein [Phaeosphaeria sp. MPI-PUGE-AT-0046c]